MYCPQAVAIARDFAAADHLRCYRLSFERRCDGSNGSTTLSVREQEVKKKKVRDLK